MEKVFKDEFFFHTVYHEWTGMERRSYILESRHVSERLNHSKKSGGVFLYRTDCFSSYFCVQTIDEWSPISEELISVSNDDVFYKRLDSCIEA